MTNKKLDDYLTKLFKKGMSVRQINRKIWTDKCLADEERLCLVIMAGTRISKKA